MEYPSLLTNHGGSGLAGLEHGFFPPTGVGVHFHGLFQGVFQVFREEHVFLPARSTRHGAGKALLLVFVPSVLSDTIMTSFTLLVDQ